MKASIKNMAGFAGGGFVEPVYHPLPSPPPLFYEHPTQPSMRRPDPNGDAARAKDEAAGLYYPVACCRWVESLLSKSPSSAFP